MEQDRAPVPVALSEGFSLSPSESYLFFAYQSVLLTVDQAAKAMQIKPGSLRNLISEKRCPFKTIPIGGARRIHIADLGGYLDRQRGREEGHNKNRQKRGRGRPPKVEKSVGCGK